MKFDRIIRDYKTYYLVTFENGLVVTLTPKQVLEILSHFGEMVEEIKEDAETDATLQDRIRRVMKKAMQDDARAD